MKIPYRYVAYTPDALPSSLNPPFSSPRRDCPRWLNRSMWWLLGAVTDHLTKKIVNEQRGELGLTAIDHVMDYFFPVERVLLAADPSFVEWPADLAHAEPPTGALLLPDRRELGAELESFLDAGDPPVYIGFGSMPDPNPRRTTAIIVDAVHRAGCRAILSSGWAKLGAADLGPRILAIGPVAHEALFARVAAIVHHGGAGTSHAAVRAGVPQVVVPHLLDQFGFAHRIHQRGLSPRPFRRSALSTHRLAESLRVCLSDAEMRERAARLGESARGHDGIANAIALLERVVNAARPSKRPPPSLRPVPGGSIAA